MRTAGFVGALLLGPVGSTACSASLGLDEYTFEDCPAATCDLLLQCGCGDEACDINLTGVPDCRPAGGKLLGASCAAPSECAAGLTCLNAADAELCVAFCERDSDCAGLGARCVLEFAGVPDVSLCTLACDIATGGGCAAGFGCQLFVAGAAGGFATHCTATGVRTAGEVCSGSSECAQGYACVPETGNSVCRRYCNADAPSCAMSESCDVSAFAGAVLGGVRYGVCR